MGRFPDVMRHAWRKIDKFFSVDVNPDPVLLYTFKSQKDVAKWRVFTDANFGGRSQAALQLADSGQAAIFSGCYSKLIGDDSSLIRSGFCGMNQVLKRNRNLSLHDYLDFRVRGDGHTYIASIRLDQYTGGDDEAWQAPLKTKNGEWENIRVDFHDFLFTVRGRLIKRPEAFGTMPTHAIMAFGITLAADKDMPAEGDFRLEIESITAKADFVQGAAADRKAFQGMFDFVEPDDSSTAHSKHKQ